MSRRLLAVLIAATAAGCSAVSGTPTPKAAALRSAVMPGWGQHSLGRHGRGNLFLGIEAATWTGVGLSYLEGVFSRDDYRLLAIEEAGMDVSGAEGDLLDDMGDFGSSDEFNDYIRRLARYYYPDDPGAQQEYFERNSYSGEGWLWSSDQAREGFQDALRESREWFRRSLYIGLFAVVNRAVSAVDAALIGGDGQVLYSDISFPEAGDLSSVRLVLGARF
jgi:hypothetical protein